MAPAQPRRSVARVPASPLGLTSDPGGPTMFDTIVVGVDGADGGRDALALADTLRRAFGSAVVAVTAYPAYQFPRSAVHDTVVERDATAFLRAVVRRAGV